jgi:60 kDa SS-A/Ro ribonucleoprotein
VVDNGRVLRTVFQMIRSGKFKNKAGKGRVGLSSSVQRAFQRWLNTAIDKWAPATEADLPAEVQSLIAYRNSESEEAQALIAGGRDNVRWDLLSDAAKGPMFGVH